MNQLKQLLHIRHQRRATVTAIRRTEQWIKAHCGTHPTALSKCVSLYVGSTTAQAVPELARIEAEAHDFLLYLQRGE